MVLPHESALLTTGCVEAESRDSAAVRRPETAAVVQKDCLATEDEMAADINLSSAMTILGVMAVTTIVPRRDDHAMPPRATHPVIARRNIY